MSTTMEALGAGTLYLVHVLTHASRSRPDAALAHLGLSSFQYTALGVLAQNDDLSSSRLSRRFHVTPQAMGELILLLERRGLIERRKDMANRKALLPGLTRRGRGVWAQADVVAKRLEDALFGEVSEPELMTLRSILCNALAVLREPAKTLPKPNVARRTRRRTKATRKNPETKAGGGIKCDATRRQSPRRSSPPPECSPSLAPHGAHFPTTRFD